MKTKDLRDQTNEQLENLLEDANREIFELVSKRALHQKLEKPHMIQERKKTRAKILTILSERKK